MPTARKIGKWSLRTAGAILALAALYAGLLVFPTPLFAHADRFGDYRVYSDEPIPADFEQVIEEVERRVEAMRPPSDRSAARIYLCGSRRRFTFFAHLTRMNPRSLAIGLSVANETFVSSRRVEDFAAANGGRLRHTRFEGNRAEVIAHEIAHFYSVDALGYRRHLAQPVWKSEGWAEYQANLSEIRGDPDYDLRERIESLLDDRLWAPGNGRVRDFWEWQLLVEFLGEVEGYDLDDLIRDDVMQAWAYEQMMDWYRAQNPPVASVQHDPRSHPTHDADELPLE